MAKHRAGRTAGIFPRLETPLRAFGLDEPRGRLFGQRKQETESAGGLGSFPVTQAMEILELIAERRAERATRGLGLADRIQLVP